MKLTNLGKSKVVTVNYDRLLYNLSHKAYHDARAAARFVKICEEFRAEFELEKRDLPDPPRVPEFLLVLLANTTQREAAVGDLNERFEREYEMLGARRARRRYWARTAKSVWPSFKGAIGRAFRWAAILAFLKRLV